MDKYYGMKTKRKDVEDDAYHDFNHFSLSSPPTKIRRLDAELPPIVEEVEEEPEIHIAFEQAADTDHLRRNGALIEELPENEERAIVLYKPMNTPLVTSPAEFSVNVNPHFTNRFKNHVLWGSQMGDLKHVGDENADENSSGSSKDRLAVVPWVPTQLPSLQGAADVHGQIDVSDMMEAEDTEWVTMDVEDSCINAEPRGAIHGGAVGINEGLHQWQHQHCMIPQPPHNISTPIVWYP